MKNLTFNHLYVALSGVVSGLIVVGGNYLNLKGLSLYEISILFPIPSIIFFGILILFKKEYGFKKQNIIHLVLYGAIFACLILSQFGAVLLGTPISIVVFLLYTQPIWTAIFEKIIYKTNMEKSKLISLVIVIIGILVLANPFSISSVGGITGIVIGLIGGISLSGWVVYGGYLTEKGNHPINTGFAWSAFGLVFILLSYVIINLFVMDSQALEIRFDLSISLWIFTIIFGFMSLVIAPLLYLEGVKKVKLSDAGIILLLEPISASFLAYFVFGQMITFNILLGAGLILLGNWVNLRVSKQISPPLEEL